MTHRSSGSGRRLAALTLPTLALLGSAALPTFAGLNPAGFTVTLDNGGIFTATRPTSGTTTVGITGTITNLTGSTETFTENVTAPAQGTASLSASGAYPFIVSGGSVPAFGVVNTDFVDLLLSPTTPLGLYTNGSVFLSDGNANALPKFTVDVLAASPPAVPEPSPVTPFALAGLALAGLCLRARSRRSRAA